MDTSIKLIIYKGSTIFDSFIVTPSSVNKYEQKVREKKIINQIDGNINEFNGNNIVNVNKICLNKKGFNAYVVSVYVVTLIKSQTYRKAALKKLLQYLAFKFSDKINLGIILIKLHTPKKQFLDYKW